MRNNHPFVLERTRGYGAWLTSLLFLLIPSSLRAEVDIDIYPREHPPVIDDQVQAQEAINSAPGNTTLVDDHQWSNQRAETVKDITDYIPGVFAQPHDGTESFRLSVRGSGLANTFQGRGLLLLQDGIPINMADGEFEFPVIDPWLISYAEVFPGANALQYGGSTFGGAINFITPTGLTEGGYDLRGEAGSFDTYHAQASYGKTWDGGDIFASATGFTQSGFRQQNNQDTSRFNANIGWQPDTNFTNRAYLSHTHADAQVPGAITLAAVYQDPRQANPLNVTGDYQRNLDITRVADKSAWKDGPDRIDTTIFYTYRMLDNPVTTYEFQHNNDLGASAAYTHTFDTSKILAGFNEYYGVADETRFKNIGGAPGTHILDRDLSAQTTEAYAHYEQNLVSNLFGIADVQTSYASRNIHQNYPYSAKQDETFAGYNPRFGLRYDVAYEQQIFANLSRSFEPPTWSELSGGNNPGFTDLKAQTATTAEAGTKWAYKELHMQAAYYHGWLRNEFVDYRFADGDTATVNAARTKRDGIELGLDGNAKENLWMANDALSIRAAYTYSHFALDHDPLYGNNTLPGVPEHYVRAEMLYHHPSGISFGPNIEWSPTPSPVDLTNSLYTDSYAIYGFRTFWESPDKRLNIYLEGRNLLDKAYVATSNVVPDASGRDGRYFYSGEGRAVYAGLRWKLYE